MSKITNIKEAQSEVPEITSPTNEPRRMIAITEQGYTLQSEPMSAADISNIALKGVYNSFQSIIQRVPENEMTACREELYDLFNVQASMFLQALIPDKELRPDLTAEAIMQMENEILDEAVPDTDATI